MKTSPIISRSTRTANPRSLQSSSRKRTTTSSHITIITATPKKLVMRIRIRRNISNTNPQTTTKSRLMTHNTKWRNNKRQLFIPKKLKRSIKNTKNSLTSISSPIIRINKHTNTLSTSRIISSQDTNNTLISHTTNRISKQTISINSRIIIKHLKLRKRTTPTNKPSTIKQNILRPANKRIRNKSTRSSLI